MKRERVMQIAFLIWTPMIFTAWVMWLSGLGFGDALGLVVECFFFMAAVAFTVVITVTLFASVVK